MPHMLHSTCTVIAGATRVTVALAATVSVSNGAPSRRIAILPQSVSLFQNIRKGGTNL